MYIVCCTDMAKIRYFDMPIFDDRYLADSNSRSKILYINTKREPKWVISSWFLYIHVQHKVQIRMPETGGARLGNGNRNGDSSLLRKCFIIELSYSLTSLQVFERNAQAPNHVSCTSTDFISLTSAPGIPCTASRAPNSATFFTTSILASVGRP